MLVARRLALGATLSNSMPVNVSRITGVARTITSCFQCTGSVATHAGSDVVQKCMALCTQWPVGRQWRCMSGCLTLFVAPRFTQVSVSITFWLPRTTHCVGAALPVDRNTDHASAAATHLRYRVPMLLWSLLVGRLQMESSHAREPCIMCTEYLGEPPVTVSPQSGAW
jgi:hypothetical protein